MNETNHDAILKKVSTLFERMNQNRQLQELAENNGIDIKNSIKLTDDNMMNVAVTLVALSLAKEANDPRYKTLVNTGLQKRSLKMEIVNDYKSQANNIIHDWKSGVTVVQSSEPQTPVEPISDEDDIQQEGFLDIFKPKPKEPPKPKRVPQNLDDVAEIIGLKDAGFDFPEDFKKGYESEAFKKLLEDPDFYVQGEIKCWPNSDIQGKKNIWKISILDYKHLESWNSSNGETGVVIVCGVRNDEWVSLNCEDGKYYLCASSMNECDSNNLMFNNFKEFLKFLNGKHFSKEEIDKLRNDDSYEINDY